MRILDAKMRRDAWAVIGVALAVLAGAFLWVGATSATADSMDEPTEEQARAAHAEVDSNRDGSVDRDEFYRRMVEVFYHNDVDKDGYLNRAELAAIQEQMVYDPADQNHDGKLTMAEYIDQRFEAFHSVDGDSDGLISVGEVVEAYTAE